MLPSCRQRNGHAYACYYTHWSVVTQVTLLGAFRDFSLQDYGTLAYFFGYYVFALPIRIPLALATDRPEDAWHVGECLPLELSLRLSYQCFFCRSRLAWDKAAAKARVRVGVKPSEENLDSESDKALMDEKDVRV